MAGDPCSYSLFFHSTFMYWLYVSNLWCDMNLVPTKLYVESLRKTSSSRLWRLWPCSCDFIECICLIEKIYFWGDIAAKCCINMKAEVKQTHKPTHQKGFEAHSRLDEIYLKAKLFKTFSSSLSSCSSSSSSTLGESESHPRLSSPAHSCFTTQDG